MSRRKKRSTVVVRAPAELPVESSDRSGATDDRDLVGLWLRQRRPETQRAYAGDAEQLLTFLAGLRLSLRTVTLGVLESYVLGIEGSDATKARKIASMRSLFRFALDTRYLTVNPAAALRVPTVDFDPRDRLVSEAELGRLAAALDPAYAEVVALIYATGARVASVCALRVRDVRLERRKPVEVTLHVKGGRTHRVQVDDAGLRTQLRARVRGRAPEAPLFEGRNGALHPATVSRKLRAAAEVAGLDKKVTAHWLRHAHASHALDRGAPVHEVAQTLGHRSLATVARYAGAGQSSGRHLDPLDRVGRIASAEEEE